MGRGASGFNWNPQYLDMIIPLAGRGWGQAAHSVNANDAVVDRDDIECNIF